MQLWGLTDPGNLREQNQDSYAMVSFSRDRSLMIVCDGMGGAKSGNVASSLAVDVFTDELRFCGARWSWQTRRFLSRRR